MRLNFLIPILTVPVLLAWSTKSHAESNCQPAPIAGWNSAWDRQNCAEATVAIDPLGAKAEDSDPHCVNSTELADAKQVQDAIKKAADAAGAGTGAKIGTAVGGPVGTVVGAIVGVAASAGISAITKNNLHVDFAMCSVTCVQLPVKATNVFVQGFSSPMPNHPGIALCDMTDPANPGMCDIPNKGRWTSMSLYTNASDPTVGQTYCSTAKNWSEDQKPTLGLRVMYDLSNP